MPETVPVFATFGEFCARYTLTPEERTKLVWYLASYRMRRTVEALNKQS